MNLAQRIFQDDHFLKVVAIKSSVYFPGYECIINKYTYIYIPDMAMHDNVDFPIQLPKAEIWNRGVMQAWK